MNFITSYFELFTKNIEFKEGVHMLLNEMMNFEK